MKTSNVPRLSIEDLRQLAAKYQSKADKYWKESLIAKAQVYDLRNLGKEVPTSEHLKCRIYDLEAEIEDLKKKLEKVCRMLENRGMANGQTAENASGNQEHQETA